MKSKFGNKVRTVRGEKNLLLREIAPLLDMDTAQLSKIERGERTVKRETVLKIASVLKTEPEDLIVLWLSDQICSVLQNEQDALLAMKLAEKRIKELKKETV